MPSAQYFLFHFPLILCFHFALLLWYFAKRGMRRLAGSINKAVTKMVLISQYIDFTPLLSGEYSAPLATCSPSRSCLLGNLHSKVESLVIIIYLQGLSWLLQTFAKNLPTLNPTTKLQQSLFVISNPLTKRR